MLTDARARRFAEKKEWIDAKIEVCSHCFLAHAGVSRTRAESLSAAPPTSSVPLDTAACRRDRSRPTGALPDYEGGSQAVVARTPRFGNR